jgi:hypothetical protein
MRIFWVPSISVGCHQEQHKYSVACAMVASCNGLYLSGYDQLGVFSTFPCAFQMLPNSWRTCIQHHKLGESACMHTSWRFHPTLVATSSP